MSSHTKQIKRNCTKALNAEVLYQSRRVTPKTTDLHSFRRGYKAGYREGLEEATLYTAYLGNEMRLFRTRKGAQDWLDGEIATLPDDCPYDTGVAPFNPIGLDSKKGLKL